jgi:hypothetical protein
MSQLPPVLVALLVAASPVAGQRLAYEGSLGMTTGRYIFTNRTTTFSLSTGLAVTAGRLTLRVALPVWLQNSTVISATGPGGTLPSGGASGGTVSDSGRGRGGRGGGMIGGSAVRARVELPGSAFTDYRAAIGDPLLGTSLLLLRGGPVRLGVGGLVKVPLADTAHYGTGEWDLGVTGSASVRLSGATLLGVDAAWWYLGDLPELDFNNPASGSLSLSHLPAARWAFSIFARGSTAAVPGFPAPVSVGGGITWLSPRAVFGLEAAAGLTATTPEFGITAYWRVQAR